MSVADIPRISGIDHIHVYVENRALAEQWYEEKLGYRRVLAFDAWATAAGPLTLENPEGNVHLALFQRDNVIPLSVIAFGSTGSDFLSWVAHLRGADTAVEIKDHDLSISMYFEDLDRNVLEITTYDHAVVRSELRLGSRSTE